MWQAWRWYRRRPRQNPSAVSARRREARRARGKIGQRCIHISDEHRNMVKPVAARAFRVESSWNGRGRCLRHELDHQVAHRP